MWLLAVMERVLATLRVAKSVAKMALLVEDLPMVGAPEHCQHHCGPSQVLAHVGLGSWRGEAVERRLPLLQCTQLN